MLQWGRLAADALIPGTGLRLETSPRRLRGASARWTAAAMGIREPASFGGSATSGGPGPSQLGAGSCFVITEPEPLRTISKPIWLNRAYISLLYWVDLRETIKIIWN